MGNVLIGEIVTSATTVRPGETLRVEVKDPTGQPYPENSDVQTKINSLRGPVQYLQFPAETSRVSAETRSVRVACRIARPAERLRS